MSFGRRVAETWGWKIKFSSPSMYDKLVSYYSALMPDSTLAAPTAIQPKPNSFISCLLLFIHTVFTLIRVWQDLNTPLRLRASRLDGIRLFLRLREPEPESAWCIGVLPLWFETFGTALESRRNFTAFSLRLVIDSCNGLLPFYVSWSFAFALYLSSNWGDH